MSARPVQRADRATLLRGVEAAVYKVVEEAPTNVVPLASARTVRIGLSHSGETLSVVKDGDRS